MATPNRAKSFKTFLMKGLLALALAGAMLLTLFAFVGCQNGQDGKDGADGANGADGAAWLAGTESPTAAQGKNGDLYLDTDDYILYQKSNDQWTVLQEDFGKPGSNGDKGADGVSPIISINANGYWVIDGVQTSTKAEGISGTTPTIAINSDGYWVINETPTGIKAQGTDGVSPTVTIDGNGYWVINGNPTGVKAQGTDGATPTIAINSDGYWVINETPTNIKAQGTDGATPTVSIDDNGYWVINETPTNVKAKALDVIVGETPPADPMEDDLFLNTTSWELFQYDGFDWISKGIIGSKQVEEEKIVDLVIFMGQSNMAGRGTAAEAPVVQEGHGYEFRAVSDPTKLYTITEPFGVNENRGVISETTKTGSLVSAFAESYYSYTGVPIVGVSAAKGGQSIDFWATGGEALNETIARYNAAKTYLTNNGYTVRHQYMVWLQGEADGKNGMSAEAYTFKLETLFNEMSKQGVEKAMVIRIGARNYDENVHDAIIQAQTDLCRQSDDFVLINGTLAGVAGADMKDEAHYLQATYNTVGADAGKNMAYYANTGMEPYFWDPKYNTYYPFGGSMEITPPVETVDQLVIDVSDPNSTYNFANLGTVSNGILTVSTNNTDKYLEPTEVVILSDDYSWTCEFIAGNFTASGGVAACSGTDGSGFIALPYKDGDVAISDKTAGFRFRDEVKSLQIDMEMPSNYDKDTLHHFAIVYDATTRTFKAYIDYVECVIVYTTGSEGSAFSDTQLSRIFSGYPTTSNAKCDFAYFAFNKKAMTVSEMKTMPETTPDPIVVSVADATHDFSQYGTVNGDKVTIVASASDPAPLVLADPIVLTDDSDWTLEIVVGGMTTGGKCIIANAGVSGSAFLSVPPVKPDGSYGGAMFRFRDQDNTFQIDMNLPADFDPAQKHHFALTYDAKTRTIRAYLDKVELTITYTKGNEENVTFNDTEFKNILSGYSGNYFIGDFYYLAFHYEVLEVSEMHS